MDGIRNRRDQVPCNLPLPRVWRWCVMATVRDLRSSMAGGYAISLPNLGRLFARRWADACELHDLPVEAPEAVERCRSGRRYIAEAYGEEMRRAWGMSEVCGEAA
jgi:hypothetical protein